MNERQEGDGCETVNEKKADVSNQAFNDEVQLEPHLERGGPLLSRLVAGYNHTRKSVKWVTFQD